MKHMYLHRTQAPLYRWIGQTTCRQQYSSWWRSRTPRYSPPTQSPESKYELDVKECNIFCFDSYNDLLVFLDGAFNLLPYCILWAFQILPSWSRWNKIVIIQGVFFNWPSPENVSRLAPPINPSTGPPLNLLSMRITKHLDFFRSLGGASLGL